VSIGLIDRIGQSFDDEIQRLTALDPKTTRFLKELPCMASGSPLPNDYSLQHSSLVSMIIKTVFDGGIA